MADILTNLSITKRQNRLEEENALQQYKTYVDGKKKQELLYQQAENNFYNELYKKADNLLSADKENIKKRSLMMQREIKNRIKEYGSRKDFFENGGLSLINKYKNDILGSEEFSLFKENKENMVKILALQADPRYADKLNEVDKRNLEKYNATGKGKITYTGMLPSLKAPDAMAYDADKNISDIDYMQYGDNYTKLQAMMEMNGWHKNPKLSDFENTLIYFRTLNISAKGKDRTKLREQEATKRAYARAKALYNKNKNKNTSSKTYVSSKMNYSLSKLNNHNFTAKKLQELADKNGGDLTKGIQQLTGDKDFRGYSMDNNLIADIGGYDEDSNYNPFTAIANNYNQLSKFVFGKNRAKLGGSRKIQGINKQAQLDAMQLGWVYSEGNKIKINPVLENDMYLSNGVKLGEGVSIDEDEYDGEYTVTGLYNAFEFGVTEGKRKEGKASQHQLYMEFFDDKNNPLKENNKRFADGLGNSTAKSVYVLGLKDDKGNVFYKKIPYESKIVRSAIMSATPELNVSEVDKQDTKEVQLTRYANQLTDVQKQQMQNNIEYAEQTAFNNPIFANHLKEYDKPGTDSWINKADLAKSATLALLELTTQGKTGEEKNTALNSLINNNAFKGLIDNSMSVQEVQDFNGTDEEFIEAVFKKAHDIEKENNTYDKEKAIQDEIIKEKWLQILSLMK